MLNDWDRVAVIEGSVTKKSECDIKSCKRKSKFMAFNDDGAPKLSRLFFCCCGKHLPIAIRKAWAENFARKEKFKMRMKKVAKEDAKKLLGIK